MTRRSMLLSASLVLFGICGLANAQAQQLTVAVGGRAFLGYLPLAIAQQLNYFKDEGLDVQVNDFASGAKSIEALVGGSVQVVLAAFEHSLLLQGKGIDLKAITHLNTTYGQVIGLKPELAKTYKSPADLKGLKFGVIGPGSASAIALNLLLAKAGLPPSSVSMIGIGGGPGAVAAVKSGQLDGISNSDPVVTQFIHDGDIVPIVDTRKPDGMKYLYGGPVAATSVLTKPATIASNRVQIQKFVNAMVRALHWLQKATPEMVADTVPPSFYGDRRDLYIEAVKANLTIYTPDGIYTPDELQNALKVLTEFGPLVGVKGVDLEKVYDNSFAKAAGGKS